MAMNLALAIILIVFYVSFLNAGLTPEERDKLMTAINKDRAEIGKKVGTNLPPLEYDVKAEEDVDKTEDCDDAFIFFKHNSVYHEIVSSFPGNPGPERHESMKFFYSNAYKIGCSKTFKCSYKLQEAPSTKKEHVGKVIESYGACKISKDYKRYEALVEKISKVGLPPLSKYADIIGVTASSAVLSGKVLSLIFSLFLVFYV